jgi:hypothetical protein
MLTALDLAMCVQRLCGGCWRQFGTGNPSETCHIPWFHISRTVLKCAEKNIKVQQQPSVIAYDLAAAIAPFPSDFSVSMY